MFKTLSTPKYLALGLALSLAFSSFLMGAADARGWSRTTTGMRGGTFSRQMSQTRTGQGTYARSGSFGGTTASGRAYGGTTSGQGSRSFQQGQGLNSSYQGQVTTNNGQTYNLDRSSSYSKNPDGGVNASQVKTVTTPNGQSYTLTNDATYSYTQGSGISKTGTRTLSNGSGQTMGSSTYNSQAAKGNGYTKNAAVTGSQGNTYNANSTKNLAGNGTVNSTTTVSNGQGDMLGGVAQSTQYQYTAGSGLQKTVNGTTQNGTGYGWSTTTSGTGN